jgi:hypothetical protein
MDSDILMKMKALQSKLDELWDEKGKTDQEMLDLSVELDRLLNQYYRINHYIWGKFKK